MRELLHRFGWEARLRPGLVAWTAFLGWETAVLRIAAGSGASLRAVNGDLLVILGGLALWAFSERLAVRMRSAVVGASGAALVGLNAADLLYRTFFHAPLGLDAFGLVGALPAASSSVRALLTGPTILLALVVPCLLLAFALALAVRRPPLRSGPLAGSLAGLALGLGGLLAVLPGSASAGDGTVVRLAAEGWRRAHRPPDRRSAEEVAAPLVALNRGPSDPPPDGRPDYPLLRTPPVRTPGGGLGRPRNVVLVLMESVRALEVGLGGDRPSALPNLRRLAEEGLTFEDAYAAGNFTIRGELSVLCGTLPNPEGGPIYMRYPYVRLSCLPQILADAGWSTYWISAYDANYGNKREFLEAHGVQHVQDVSGFAGRHLEMPKLGWGPSDQDMYAYALDVLDGAKRPFFAELMTLSNHHPWEDDYGLPHPPGFDLAPQSEAYRNYLQGLYYTDEALGAFVEAARAHPWFDDTLFVFVGDHGTWVMPHDLAAADPARQVEAFFRTPLVFWSPANLAPRTRTEVASQIDVAPTILDLLGVSAPAAFTGRSLLGALPADRTAVMWHDGELHVREGDTYCYRSGKDCFRFEGDLLSPAPGTWPAGRRAAGGAALLRRGRGSLYATHWLLDHDAFLPQP